jgi:hypothetical protein
VKDEKGYWKRDESGEYMYEDALDDDGNRIPEDFSSYRVSVKYPCGFTSYNESLIDFNVDEMMEFMAVISSYAEDKKDQQKNLPTLAKKIRTQCEVALTQAHTRAVRDRVKHIEACTGKGTHIGHHDSSGHVLGHTFQHCLPSQCLLPRGGQWVPSNDCLCECVCGDGRGE